MQSRELTFDELPKELKEVYQESALTKKDSFFYEIKSLDLENNISHYWSGMNKGLLTKGHNHHFLINGQEFKLRANQGDPFVLRNNKLYYTEKLNLSAKNFEKATYVEIDLAEYLNKKASCKHGL
ncbi:MAG: hypothetical protein CMH48_04705 [Muricauda sp.]|nr:hypothetical protein [Allomuricauda sp.]